MKTEQILCRPKWYGKDADGKSFLDDGKSPLAERVNPIKYTAVKVSKEEKGVKSIFYPEALDKLPEDFVWMIITSEQLVWRTNAEFLNDFDVVQ